MSEERDRLAKFCTDYEAGARGITPPVSAIRVVLSALEAAEAANRRWEAEEVTRASNCCGQEERAEAAEVDVSNLRTLLTETDRQRVEVEAENAALRAEALRLAGEHARHAADDRAVIADLRAEVERLKAGRDGMLREAVRALEHWLAKGAKVVWTPYLTPSACRELLRAAGFYGADQLEQARAALASGESREPATLTDEQVAGMLRWWQEQARARGMADLASAGPAEEPGRCPHGSSGPCSVCGDQG